MGKTVLAVMDLQRGILGRFEPQEVTSYLQRVSRAITATRNAGIVVIYVTMGFRLGHPELSHRNMSTPKVASFGGFLEGSQAVEIHPDVAPIQGDVIVTKRRVSAFTGSDLEVILRSMEIENLVLVGVATSGAVLSTVRQAADLDYRVTVLKDLCMDPDTEVQRVLTEKIFPRQAQVLSSEEWIAGLQ